MLNPTQPPPVVSNYQDPADRVASAKVKADDIKTWSVSEVDKKGKKKKGTLGVGNGAVFFASESDKVTLLHSLLRDCSKVNIIQLQTPVQKWQTVDIDQTSIEKSKHLHIAVGGASPVNLHFNVGSKDNAEAILEKLQSSKALSTPTPSASPQRNGDVARPPPILTDAVDHDKTRRSGASVHFSESSPVIIPSRKFSESEDYQASEANLDGETAEGDIATALYDFDADGEDELSVKEGDSLLVLERDGDEWWKCRNSDGAEGVVPASYLEVSQSFNGSAPERN
jgi:hypothetical protein